MRPLALPIIAALFLTPVPTTAHEATDAMLQCMADCIIEEGKDEKTACKQRCAYIYIDMRGMQNRDCMAVFKQCKKDCEGDNDCRKTCKTALLNCV